MADENAQQASDQQASDQQAADPNPTDAAKAATEEEMKAELERTRIALRAANKEAAERRKRLEELEKAEEARKQAEMTELDRLKAENEALRKQAEAAVARAQDTLIRAAFVAEAAKAGAAHPDDVYLLADKSGVLVDDDGTVSGVAEAVKALIDAGRVPLAGKPKAPALDGGAGSGDRGNGSASVKLTPEEIAAAKKMGISLDAYAKRKAEREKVREAATA